MAYMFMAYIPKTHTLSNQNGAAASQILVSDRSHRAAFLCFQSETTMQIVGRASGPLHAGSVAPTAVVALPFCLIDLRCVLCGDLYSRFVWINLGLAWISI
jgi:hypothetical protein